MPNVCQQTQGWSNVAFKKPSEWWQIALAMEQDRKAARRPATRHLYQRGHMLRNERCIVADALPKVAYALTYVCQRRSSPDERNDSRSACVGCLGAHCDRPTSIPALALRPLDAPSQ